MLLERVSHWSDQQCLGDIFADQVSVKQDAHLMPILDTLNFC